MEIKYLSLYTFLLTYAMEPNIIYYSLSTININDGMDTRPGKTVILYLLK